MKFKTKGLMLALLIAASAMFFSSCKKNDSSTSNPLASTPLYDTLGWFIQGAKGSPSGQGTVMVADPANNGQKIQAGRLAIRTVVNKALPIIAGDPQLAIYFPVLLGELGQKNTTGYNELLTNFTDFVQQAVSGQTGLYTGLSMLQAHHFSATEQDGGNPRFGSSANQTADAGDFTKFIGDVVIAAQSLNVPNSVIGQLGVILNSVQGDVVQDKNPPKTSALYDTLGWFIQGAKGSGPYAGQGTSMMADPDNSGSYVQAGRLAIRTVVKTALPMIAGDNQLKVYFPVLIAELGNKNTTGFSDLLETFTDFVQAAVSGQDIYKGKSMIQAHNFATYNRFGDAQHPTADSADFDHFVGIVATAATSLKVPRSVIGQLGTLLYTTEGDVVQDK
ncbi:hypothetical protein [Arachidicoccus sp.]|uniref:hypothetical protein n=1 Tax=Arachidicoccus sp. TaxID=1872624 RepID=UPI003D24D9C2